MSLIQPTARKRPRSSFSDWNSLLQNNFCSPESEIAPETSATSVAATQRDASVIVIDAEENHYGLNTTNTEPQYTDDDSDSIIFVKEHQLKPYPNDDDRTLDENSLDNLSFVDKSTRPSFNTHILDHGNINENFNLNKEMADLTNNNVNSSNGTNMQLGMCVGLKKRRTNSLPQLPLSKISYRRVSELSKIGEIRPNLVLPTKYHSSSISSGSSTQSDASSSYSYLSASTSPSSSVQSENGRGVVTDENGYYIAEPGEYFANGRFKILDILGQGTFGKVIKALDLTRNETVAIKIIRAIPKYREASKIELRVLATLKNADPENLNNCIHLREVLDYENHICIITDLLDISLYEFLQSNKFRPFPGSQIQAITRQLIRSVAFLHDLKLIHTDLKPENILLTSSDFLKFKKSKVLKNPLINIIDFGSAIFNDEYHSELVSTRHYRAPEIVLGTGWSFPCDMWSLGCILVELVTGEALFNTHENLEHLAIMEKVFDEKLPNSMIKRVESQSVKEFFVKRGHNYELAYPRGDTSEKSIEAVKKVKRLDDWVCSKLKLKIKINMHASLQKNWDSNKKVKDLHYETFQFWYYFIDLVRKLLKYDPSKRITAIDALSHPWWDFGVVDEATSSLM
ncbi:CYFA0S04e06260g1_1 [Cyberlindnera fabianii]|uniref:CYFA0S04e06260g1_1 n=1 Tax=Cyberlindnera fabianii TaxID=36022 RepID=A0A061AZP2_CYBFA|nr:Dual specificity protein kinase KNS1 [Cyberlindnera fabianii]CDR40223.1 CYFA0S04e06260g1_1 [Cyberlindnera fabianii]